MTDLQLTDEAARLDVLRRYAILDTGPEERFDKITGLVRTVLNVPISAVSLIDADRQWLKSHPGLKMNQTPRSMAFCHYTIQRRIPLVVPDATRDSRFAANPLVTGEPFIRSYAGVPLQSSDGYNLGSLCAIDTVARPFPPEEVAILERFAALVVDELELRLIAHRDQLTGVLTRRGFIERAEQAFALMQRQRRTGSLVIFDLDHFKSINDRFGHGVGDTVLQRVAHACDAVLRPSDSFGRLGGEEFVILLPETGSTEAFAVAERLRLAISALVFPDTPGLRVTASFGVAPLDSSVTELDGWLEVADTALYAAKKEGRNRSLIATPPLGAAA